MASSVRSQRATVVMVVGLVFGFVGYIYAMEHSDELPMFFPGRTTTRHIRGRHGLAAVHSHPHTLFGAVLLLLAVLIFGYGVWLAVHSD